MIQTNIEWPKGLPNPLREGHALQPAQTFERTEMANGRARNRVIHPDVPIFGTWGFIFTDNQAAFFEMWFKDALKDGRVWFKIPRKTPLGMRMLTCRFTAMYSGPSMIGRDRWRYDLPLEIYQREFMDTAWIGYPEMWNRMNIFDIAMNHDWPKYEPNS